MLGRGDFWTPGWGLVVWGPPIARNHRHEAELEVSWLPGPQPVLILGSSGDIGKPCIPAAG